MEVEKLTRFFPGRGAAARPQLRSITSVTAGDSAGGTEPSRTITWCPAVLVRQEACRQEG